MTIVIKQRYQVTQKISESQMGAAFFGTDLKNKTPVYIKSYRTEFLSGQLVEQLHEAIFYLIEMHHSNIIPIVDYESSSTAFSIVHPYGNEKPLSEIFSQIQSFTTESAIDLMRNVIKAVEYAHRKRVLHGALNEAQIFLNAQGQPLVSGFLIQDMVNHIYLKKNMVVEQAGYLSPEQVWGDHATPRSDVFALAALFYRMVCGQTPFGGDQNAVRQMKNLTSTPVKPSLFNAQIPAYLDDILMQALDKNPLCRPATPLDFLRNLENKAVKDRYNADLIEDEMKFKLPPIPKPIQKVVDHPQVRKVSKNLMEGLDKTVERMDEFVNDERPLEVPFFKNAQTFRQKVLLWSIIAIALGIFLSIARSGTYLFFTATPEVEVPSIVGLSLQEAIHTVESSHLRYRISGEAFHAEVPKDHVYNQAPPPGKHVKEKRYVKIYVSKGTREAVVPALVGQTLDQVAPLLEKLKVKLSITEQTYSNTIPRGSILSQNPESGIPVFEGSTINVSVSQGFPATLTVTTANAEQKIAVIEMFVPGDWLHQKVKIQVDHAGVQEIVFEKEIFPTQRARYQTVQPNDAVISVFYNDDVGLRTKLSEYKNAP